MNSNEIKTNIHKIIDGIENEAILEEFLLEISMVAEQSKKGIWQTLTASQKEEILASYEESMDEKNLINNDEVFKPFKNLL